ncbi:MAG: hypothetical protein C0403_04130 [Desulfobacterium sp.]|nr:hypothetical protein [Desulfobacterium sp.]
MMMDKKQEVESLLHEWRAKFASFGKEFEVDESIDNLVKSFVELLALPQGARKNELKRFQSGFEEKYGTDARVSLCQLIIFSLFCENEEKIDYQNLPDGVVEYIKEDFVRAIKIATQGNDKILTVNNTIYNSYVEVMSFIRFPIGNQSVVVAGFSRSVIRLQSPLKMISFMRLLFSCGGNYPLYELHYNPHRMRSFNPEGWQTVMRLGAELLKLRPAIKGIFAGAWFFDPALKDISPELSYLRELIFEVGGMIFFTGSNEQAITNAFAMSKIRKTAFEKGRYNPANYLAIIPRKTLLKHFKI